MWLGTRLPSVEIMHKDVRESDIKTSLLLLQSAEGSWRKDDRLLVVCSLAELWLYVPRLPLSFSLPLSTHLRTILSLSWGTTLVTVDINTLLCHWDAQHRSENIWQALFIDPAGGQAKSTATRSSLFWSRVPQKSPQQKGAAKPGGREHNLAMVGFFFCYRTVVAVMGGESCCGVYKWKWHIWL